MMAELLEYAKPSWRGSFELCHLTFWSSYILLYSSVYMVVFISRDRYLLVKDVIRHRLTQTPKTALKLIAGSYVIIVGFTTSIFVWLVLSDNLKQFCASQYLKHRKFQTFMVFVDIVIPVTLLLGYNVLMLKGLKGRRSELRSMMVTPCNHKQSSSNHGHSKSKMKLSITPSIPESINYATESLATLEGSSQRTHDKELVDATGHVRHNIDVSFLSAENNWIQLPILNLLIVNIPLVPASAKIRANRRNINPCFKEGKFVQFRENESMDNSNKFSSLGAQSSHPVSDIIISESDGCAHDEWKNIAHSFEEIKADVISETVSISAEKTKAAKGRAENFTCAECKAMQRKQRELDGCKKAVKTVTTLVCVFLICWLPYYIAAFLKVYDVVNVSYTVSTLMFVILCSNSAINPCLYVVTHNGFRHVILQLFPLTVLRRCRRM
ncbi:Muscarinic acetylcholine receptor gar-3 [Holothuria leucospilota]|uniref:Muscarinic acetylcholine receptor gar-3 n=1 Tax=Holothuria leucospilota TaxID=206669 RepID=A0A9Q1BH05_HOLLE|nr:Muscarinic acetylcholine receptor gar-3 [Holothuria leucospilota]